jgi:hypothetical protein
MTQRLSQWTLPKQVANQQKLNQQMFNPVSKPQPPFRTQTFDGFVPREQIRTMKQLEREKKAKDAFKPKNVLKNKTKSFALMVLGKKTKTGSKVAKSSKAASKKK